MSEPIRQLDVPLKGKRPANAPIPGSTRERVMRQADALLPGIMNDNGGRPVKPPKAHPTRQAWGEAASAGGFALALSLRSRGLKWAVRVLTLVLWFVVPNAISGLIMLVWLAWAVVGVSAWVKRHTKGKKPLDTCQCGH